MAVTPLFFDRVRETTTTTGTGTLTLAGAVRGYQSFAVVQRVGSAKCTYCIQDIDNDAWEVGVGAYTLSGTTLSRATVLASSNNGDLVNFAAGIKHVFLTSPADYAFPNLKASFGGRLTLTAVVPVDTNDVTGATALYYVAGNSTYGMGETVVTLWTGNSWRRFPISNWAQFAYGAPALTSGKNYDVFMFTSDATPSSTDTSADTVTFGSATGWQTGSMVEALATGGGLSMGTGYWWNAASSTSGSFHTSLANALAGTSKVDLTANITQKLRGISLELSAAWTNDTTRADALTNQDGLRVKNSDNTRLLMGTIRASGTNTMECSDANRLVRNEFNQVLKRLFTCPAFSNGNSDTTHTTTSTVWQAANGGTGSRVSFLTDFLRPYLINAHAVAKNSGSNVTGLGLGVDSTSVAKVGSRHVSTVDAPLACSWQQNLGAEGYHTVDMLVRVAAGTGTFTADEARNGSVTDPFLTYLMGHIWV